jgi:hypothetical protein
MASAANAKPPLSPHSALTMLAIKSLHSGANKDTNTINAKPKIMISPTIVDFFMDLEDQQQQKSAFF